MTTEPFRTEARAEATMAGARDFDFLHGRWTVAHRRLQRRLVGDAHWDEFPGQSEARPILGGLGNVDDNVIALPSGTYRGATLRLFDPSTSRWSIRWMDSRTPAIQPPVHGRFANGTGTFFGDDAHEGRPIRVRFIWSLASATSARWEQAFSADGEASWEVNWVMQFSRGA